MSETLLLVFVACLMLAALMAFFFIGYQIGRKQGRIDRADEKACVAAELRDFDALGQYPALDDEDYVPF